MVRDENGKPPRGWLLKKLIRHAQQDLRIFHDYDE